MKQSDFSPCTFSSRTVRIAKYRLRNAATATDDELFDAIAQAEAEIAKCEAISAKPKALTAKIEELRAGIAALVAHMDAKVELFEAVVATLISHGISNLQALRASERAIAFLVKEAACPSPTRALRRDAAAPSLRIAKYRLLHDFDDDAVCVKCGFDKAEWWHYRQTQHPDDRDPNELQPECTR